MKNQCGRRTVFDYIRQICRTVAGRPMSVKKHLGANNTTEAVNCFQLYGTVELYRLYGIVIDATTLTHCDEVHFDLWDGANSRDITANQAVLSGAQVDSYFLKLHDRAEPLVVCLNTTCQVGESMESTQAFHQCTLAQKSGADTFVRFRYRTTDTPIDAMIQVFAHFAPLDGGRLMGV